MDFTIFLKICRTRILSSAFWRLNSSVSLNGCITCPVLQGSSGDKFLALWDSLAHSESDCKKSLVEAGAYNFPRSDDLTIFISLMFTIRVILLILKIISNIDNMMISISKRQYAFISSRLNYICWNRIKIQ